MEKAFVKRDSALLERFCVSETMFTPCYLLVQCRTNLDDYRIFVYFERIVKVLEGGFSFFIATGLRKIYDFPRCGRFFCVCLSLQVTVSFLYRSLPLTKGEWP